MPEIVPLSRSAERALAAQMLYTASNEPLVITRQAAVLLADLLDAVSWQVLDQAGLERDEARAVLAALWGHASP